MKKRDHDTPANKFPPIWNSGEDALEVNLDEIINKHVYLAIQEYAEDVFICPHAERSRSGKITKWKICAVTAEQFEKAVSLEEALKLEDEYWHDEPGDLESLAAELDRLAAKARSMIKK